MTRLLHYCFYAIFVCMVVVCCCRAQDSGGYDTYGDYGGGDDGYGADEPDNLYADYAQHAQDKVVAGAGAGPGWTQVALGTGVGWLVGGKFHSRRVRKKLELKHKKDQKELYQQYYNDVYALQKEKAELLATLEQYTKKR